MGPPNKTLHRMKLIVRTCFLILFQVMLIFSRLESSLYGQRLATQQKPYSVVYADGRSIEGNLVQKDHFFAHGRSNAHLDDQAIFIPNNHVRLIRNRQKSILREGPYIEFVNGDILPGQVEGIGVANPGRNMPDYLRVRLTAPLTNHLGNNSFRIKVRADQIARFVTHLPESGHDKSGYIWLKSGVPIEFRLIQWQPNTLKALTTKGVQAIPIHDVAKFYQPVKNRIRRILDEKKEIGFDSSGHQVMFQTVNGARLTTREDKMVRHSESRTMIQPYWALDAIMLSPEDIVEVLFLRLGEFPLSALPAETLEEKNYLAKWKWARNRNVRGGRLNSGDRDGPIGVGMHPYTAVVQATLFQSRN